MNKLKTPSAITALMIPFLPCARRMSLLLLTSVFLFSSCSDEEEPSPAPNPTPEDAVYTMKLASSEKMEFKKITGKNESQDITGEETVYFGERIKLASPNELQFDNDSLFIVKANDMTERYKTKWQNNELFLHNASTDAWEYCGKKEADGKFLFNTGFYITRSSNAQRTLTVMDQRYALTSFSELMDKGNEDKSSTIVWLKMEYVFTKK